MHKRISKVLIIFMLGVFLFGITCTSTYAMESVELGENETIIYAWDESETYDYNDKVVYDEKIYIAKYWTKGDNPSTCAQWGAWTLDPVLNVPTDATDSEVDLVNEGLTRVNVPIVRVNPSTTKSKYTYTIRNLTTGYYVAFVNSTIFYDNGKFAIVKMDRYTSVTCPLSQTKSYSFNKITKVMLIVNGTYNGQVVPSKAMVVYP